MIKELCLINLFIISSIFLSFKVYQIYLFYMKEYLFYFDDQQIYRNEYVKSWIELITYQVIINFQNYCFFNFLYSNPSFFLFQYIIEKWNFLLVWPDFQNHNIILFVIVNQNYVLMFRQLMKCKLHYNIISSELHKPKF